MNTVAKIFVVLNLAFALIYVGVAATLLQKQEHWKLQFYQEKKAHEEETAKLKSDIEGLTSQNNNFKRQIDDWRARHDSVQQQLEAQTNENKNLEQKWKVLEGNYTALQENYNQLKDKLVAVQAQKDELHNTLEQKSRELSDALKLRDQAVDDRQRVQKELEDLKVDIRNLKERHVDLAKKKSELEWILVQVQEKYNIRIDDAWPAIPKIDGRVVGVSNKVNLVVISVGEDDGVKVGFEFTIYRGNSFVGKLVVEKVYPNQAACRVDLDKTKDKVQPGDQVSTQVY